LLVGPELGQGEKHVGTILFEVSCASERLLYGAGGCGERVIRVGTDQAHRANYQNQDYRKHDGVLSDVLTLLVGPELGQGEKHVGTILGSEIRTTHYAGRRVMVNR
jgi:hypothetical protein